MGINNNNIWCVVRERERVCVCVCVCAEADGRIKSWADGHQQKPRPESAKLLIKSNAQTRDDDFLKQGGKSIVLPHHILFRVGSTRLDERVEIGMQDRFTRSNAPRRLVEEHPL